MLRGCKLGVGRNRPPASRLLALGTTACSADELIPRLPRTYRTGFVPMAACRQQEFRCWRPEGWSPFPATSPAASSASPQCRMLGQVKGVRVVIDNLPLRTQSDPPRPPQSPAVAMQKPSAARWSSVSKSACQSSFGPGHPQGLRPLRAIKPNIATDARPWRKRLPLVPRPAP